MSVIREFVAAPADGHAAFLLGVNRALSRIEVVGMLMARALSAETKGNDALADRLASRVALLVGSHDLDTQQWLADLANLDRLMSAPDPSEDDIDRAGRFIVEHSSSLVAGGYAAALMPSVWDGLMSLGSALFTRSGDESWMQAALDVAKAAVEMNPPGTEEMADSLLALGGLYTDWFDISGDRSHLDESIAVSRRAVEVSPLIGPRLSGRMNVLAGRLAHHYHVFGERWALDDAIQESRSAVTGTPKLSPELSGRLNNLANRLVDLYQADGDQAHLTEAIATARQAVSAAPAHGPELPALLANLAAHLGDRYAATSDQAVLTDAIVTCRRAIQATSGDDGPGLGDRQAELATRLGQEYDLERRPASLQEAVAVWRQAVAMTPKGHDDRPDRFDGLARRLAELHELTGDSSLLDEAIEVAGLAVIEMSPGPEVSERRSRRALLLDRRYLIVDDLDALRLVVVEARQTIEGTTRQHPDYADRLYHLAIRLADLSSRTSSADEAKTLLDEVVWASREVVDATWPTSPSLATRLVDLGSVLCRQYDRDRIRQLLDDAIGALGRAINLTVLSDDRWQQHLDAVGEGLAKLATVDGSRELRDTALGRLRAGLASPPGEPLPPIGQMLAVISRIVELAEIGAYGVELDEAVSAARKAHEEAKGTPATVAAADELATQLVSLYRADGKHEALDEALTIDRSTIANNADDPNLGERLLRFVSALEASNLLDPKREVLAETISVQQRSIEQTPDDDPELTARLNALAVNLAALHITYQDPSSLAEAVDMARRATTAASTPAERALSFSVLSDLLSRLYSVDGEVSLLDEAVSTARQAAQFTRPSSPEEPGSHHRLSIRLLEQFAVNGQTEILDEAVLVAREAADATPVSSPERPTHLDNLANALARTFGIDGVEGTLVEAVAAARGASEATLDGDPS
ncbi:MAG: tetratricopeptide repeat protein, partial [Actinomycetia bacterium]|nr:tetratricopeptide repeat protein [Actinomycetes bacterium]